MDFGYPDPGERASNDLLSANKKIARLERLVDALFGRVESLERALAGPSYAPPPRDEGEPHGRAPTGSGSLPAGESLFDRVKDAKTE